jgi:hypothetical protein
MKVKGLDDRLHPWTFTNCDIEREHCSELHKRARLLLHELYKSYRIYEEVPLPGSKLTCDFYVPLRKTMIEVQGEQHYKYVGAGFFYKNKTEFAAAQQRDRNKELFCSINGIELVTLPYNESDEQWKQRLGFQSKAN